MDTVFCGASICDAQMLFSGITHVVWYSSGTCYWTITLHHLLSSVIQIHNFDYRLYADDTHIYLSLETMDKGGLAGGRCSGLTRFSKFVMQDKGPVGA